MSNITLGFIMQSDRYANRNLQENVCSSARDKRQALA